MKNLKPKQQKVLLYPLILGLLLYLVQILPDRFFQFLALLNYKAIFLIFLILLFGVLVSFINWNYYIKKHYLPTKQWETKKNQYELFEISHGIWVYILKNSNNSNSNQWYCTNCIDVFHVFSLYKCRNNSAVNPTHHYICQNPECQNEISIDNPNYNDIIGNIDFQQNIY